VRTFRAITQRIVGALFGPMFGPNEPDRPDSFTVLGMKLWPKADAYTVLLYPLRESRKYGLGVRRDGGYIEVLVYDSGIDPEYGRIRSGRWMPLSAYEDFSRLRIERIRLAILGKPEPVIPVSVTEDSK